MTHDSKRAVVVTGASTGIGEACVAALVESGFFVFGSVRKAQDGARLQSRFGASYAPLIFDVTDAAAIGRAAQEVETQLAGATLAGLVNNAGIAVPGPLLHLPIADFRRQIEINLIGQLQVTQAFAPLLGAREPQGGPPGRIVNMSSVAGRFATPFLGAYNASKFGLEGMSDALRRELMIYGIDVVVIEPGMIATPIWDKADAADFGPFDETVYGPAARRMQKWLVGEGRAAPGPDMVASAVLRALTAPRAPLRIPVMKSRFLGWTLPGLLPMRLIDWLTARRLGFTEIRKKVSLLLQEESEMANQPVHGVVCWNELGVHDLGKAQKFYAETLGWRFEAVSMPDMTYWIIFSGEARVGGMFEMQGAQFEGVPDHWLTYIAVDDVDGRLHKAVAAGARICKEAFDIPGVGRMAVLAEPGGAVVAWMTPKM